MTAKKIIAGSALLALLLLAALYLVRKDSGPGAVALVERDPARPVTRALRHTSIPGIRPVLSWMYERGIAARRISGQVRIEGRPAPGVEVRLHSEPMMYSELAQPRLRSDEEGRFDFGAWPATQYAVVAGGGPYELAITHVDLANPRVQSEDLSIELETCSREGFGRVRSLFGEEITGATLSVATNMRPANRFRVSTQAIEADGSFRLCLSRKRTDLVIDAPGFAQASLYDYEGQRMPPQGYQVELLPAGAIRGRVVDTRRQGIAGARVSSFGTGLAHHLSLWKSTLSEPDGSFVLDAQGPGKYELAFDHYDYNGVGEWQTVTLAPGEVKEGIVLVGADCRKIAGTILSEDSTPLVGVSLWGVLSQSDGSFVIKCAPFESFELDVPRYGSSPVRVPEGSVDLDDLVIRVPNPRSLSGRVLLGDAPVAGARVTLRPAKDSSLPDLRSLKTQSDAQGHYRFDSVLESSYELAASDDQGMSGSQSLSMRDSDMERDLVIFPGTKVKGTLKTEDGVGVSKVTLVFTSESGETVYVTTDAGSGHFQTLLSGNESHTVSLHPEDAELEPLESTSWPSIEAAAGEQTLELRLAGAAQTLKGQVVYEDQSPVANAWVRVFPSARTQTSDESGAFAFEGLPKAASFKVYATDLMGLKGNLQNIDSSRVAGGALRIVIERGASIRGSVVDAPGECRISLQGREMRISHSNPFRFDDLRPGDYSIEARCGEAVAGQSLAVSPGGAAELSLTLGSGHSIRGIVKRFPSGEPIAGLPCSAGMAESTSDERGHFQIDGVAPAVTKIRCQRFGATMAMAAAALSLPADAQRDIEVWGVESEAGLTSLMEARTRLGAKLTIQEGQPVFTEVDDAGACKAAGIQSGDVLHQVSGVSVEGRAEIATTYLQSLPAGGSVTIEIARGEQSLLIRLLL